MIKSLCWQLTVVYHKSGRDHSTPSISQLGRGIRKVIFICGDIKDLVLEADKHIEFLDDPDALVDDFDGLDEEQVEALKRECVIIFC